MVKLNAASHLVDSKLPKGLREFLKSQCQGESWAIADSKLWEAISDKLELYKEFETARKMVKLNTASHVVDSNFPQGALPGRDISDCGLQIWEGVQRQAGITSKRSRQSLGWTLDDDLVRQKAENWCSLQQVKRARMKDKEVCEEEVGEKLMDRGNFWSDLQYHVPLDLVWEKLPQDELFRLRTVCKEWNTSALQRLEAKPYFVNFSLGPFPIYEPYYFNGLFHYDVGSKELSFNRHKFLSDHGAAVLGEAPFAVEGLVFCCPGVGSQGVYNVHTRVWHEVPQLPETSMSEVAVCGMMVDTSVRPYTFKLVVGSPEKRTQIYDSRRRSWTMASSMVSEVGGDVLAEVGSYCCVNLDGCLYMALSTCSDQDMILVYSMGEDHWSELAFPSDEGDDVAARPPRRHSLGVWDRRIFCVMDDAFIWELVDVEEGKWELFDCCIEDVYLKLFSGEGEYDDRFYELSLLMSFFCDEYLLVCNWRTDLNRAVTNAILNLRTREWEFLCLPEISVS